MSDTAKSPAQVINDLSDQVRLLRQDVAVLTATATSKKDAAALRAAVQASAQEAHERGTEALKLAEHVVARAYQANLEAARDGAAKAVAGLQDEVRQAANRMRLETLKGRREALYWSGGVLAVFGGVAALGALLGALGHFWLQGSADARAFGENPGMFCEVAGGTVVPKNDGRRFCAFWIDPPTSKPN